MNSELDVEEEQQQHLVRSSIRGTDINFINKTENIDLAKNNEVDIHGIPDPAPLEFTEKGAGYTEVGIG